MVKVDCKVILLGNTCVGKTSLFQRFITGKFNDKYVATLCWAFRDKVMHYNGKEYHMGIWDTAGGERFAPMTKNFYRGAKAAILCYDIFDEASWKGIIKWHGELTLCEPECTVYLCGTKIDLLDESEGGRAISQSTVTKYAHNSNAKMIEVSSKTGKNIEELFYMIIEDYVKDCVQREDKDRIQLKPNDSQGRRCCSP